MTEADTGATSEQLEAAATRFELFAWTPDSIASQVQFWASKLIPADHRLIGPDDLRTLRRVRNLYASSLGMGYPLSPEDFPNHDDFECLDALVGDR